MPKIVKLRKVGDSLVVTIPKDIAEALNWSVGDRINIEVTGINSLTIRKK